MKRLLMATVAFVSFGSVAYAADLPVKAPAAAGPYVGSPFNWNGIYIGLHGGWEFGANDVTANVGNVFSDGVPIPGTASTTSLANNASGGFGGGHIGFNYQMTPAWVIGTRFDIDASGLSGTTADPALSGASFIRSVPWHGDFVGRLGYLIGPQTMFYGVGGVSFGEIKDTATTPFSGILSIETSNVHVGWVAGVGVEHYLTQSLSVGAEWNYYDLGTHGVAFESPTTTSLTFNTNDKAAWNSMKAFLSVKF